MLFEPDRHEALAAPAWNEARAHEALQRIVRDTEDERGASGHWPVHPRDDEGDTPPGGFKSLYLGSAGVWWALWTLQRQGAVTLRGDPVAGIRQTAADYAAAPDTGEAVPSYFLGIVGIELVRWRILAQAGAAAEAAQAADAVFAAVQANIANPTNEALWAAPGTMVAAWHLAQSDGAERWRTLLQANVEQLWRTWLWDGATACHLWTQDMYERRTQYLGAGHGFVGNVYALLKNSALLDEARRRVLHERCVATLQRFAVHDGDAVNWQPVPPAPPGAPAPRPGAPRLLMQWCHGAPGFVTALADFPTGVSDTFETLMRGAGEAVWRAGPLTKGAGLCHGTAGNGHALLKLWRRSGDVRWLERARAFAMHAMVQVERARAEHGRGRHTLWTGDLGVAMFLWHCLRGEADLPALDTV